jgi:hypothetical protein
VADASTLLITRRDVLKDGAALSLLILGTHTGGGSRHGRAGEGGASVAA